MDERKARLIELKKACGLARPDEIEALANTPVVTGAGLVAPRPVTMAEWCKRWDGALRGPNALTPDPGAIREPR